VVEAWLHKKLMEAVLPDFYSRDCHTFDYRVDIAKRIVELMVSSIEKFYTVGHEQHCQVCAEVLSSIFLCHEVNVFNGFHDVECHIVSSSFI